MALASDRADRTFCRALEKHVLDHMRYAGNAVVFVEVSGFNKGIDADKRNGLLLTYKNGQSVLEDNLRGLSLIFSKRVRFHDLRHLKKEYECG